MEAAQKPNPWKSVFLASACWIFFVGILMIVSSTVNQFIPPNVVRLVYGIEGTIAALAAIWVVLKFETPEDRIPPPYIEKAIPSKFAAGFLIGTVLIGIIVIVIYALTDVRFVANDKFSLGASWLGYLAIIPLALMEEIAFRGWSFRKLNQSFDIRITQLIVAIGFALYHVLNGWGFAGSFVGPFVWAFIFGLAAWLTKGIAVSTGIHVALNVFQVILGFKQSDSSIWHIKTEEDVANINNLGMIMQGVMLVIGLYLTFYFYRRRAAAGETTVS